MPTKSPLSKSALLARIPPRDLDALVRSAEKCSFWNGQLLFQRGDAGDAMYAIISGKVKVFLETEIGDEVLVATRGVGDVLGEQSLLDGQQRSASAAASGPVQAICISREAFRTWLSEHPAASFALLEELSLRLREATDQVGEIALLPVETRVARKLWQTFVGAALEGEPAKGDVLKVNQGEMAAGLSVTRESVNKHFAKLKAQKVIETGGGKVTLLRPDALRGAAGNL